MYSTSIKGFLLRLSNNYLPVDLYQVHLGYPSHHPQQHRAGLMSYGEVVKHRTYH